MGYTPRGNDMLLTCVDELLRRIELGEPRPAALISPNLGDSVSSQIDAALEGHEEDAEDP